MRVERALPTREASDLLDLVQTLVNREIAPRAAVDEERAAFPRDLFTRLGRAGLLGLPYPADYGGGGQPYEVYLQVVEELARGWLAVGLGVSVHTLACFPLAGYGAPDLREALLGDLIGGELLGAYCLSEADSGSDAAAMATTATPVDGGYLVNGTKAWTTHGGVADFYTLFARTGGSGPGARGISCLHVPASTEGVSAAPPERKMGMASSPTASVRFDAARVDGTALIGERNRGFGIALAALDSGRLGIAACAVGVAQAAMDIAVDYARERRQFDRPISEFQGVGFLLADMATQVEAARELYLAAARRRDLGQPFGARAAMAKLFASDTAMRVTTDAVQVLGGAGYTRDHPAERLMREAKALQIVEGTNQIQRMVINRHLDDRG
ncbi:acyl-CoA dehydrogenase family protein [Halostreptopolyspora alba]|uniref:Acyl-CoA dehydrogenase n=1 Tax=Halostreptopolyspora alba TaxID=2487137 RepID=A0A3N0EGN8_9ACTN|nr:acyl-CoA dehydrogenase [Nocardiopsaceae bacterium YIM 96095]